MNTARRQIMRWLDGELPGDELSQLEQWALARPSHADLLLDVASDDGALERLLRQEDVQDLLVSLYGFEEGDNKPAQDEVISLVVDEALERRRRFEIAQRANRMLREQQQAERASRRCAQREALQHEPPISRAIVIPRWAFIGGVAAAVLSVAWLGWIVMPRSHQGGIAAPPGTVAQAKAAPSAVVGRSLLAAWADQATVDASGDLRPGGVYRLDSGLVELAFGDGALVVVEGPSEFEVLNDNALHLSRGRCVARIPESAYGFEVRTPTASVTDLGTEFAVEVVHDGATLAHVFQGEVVLSSSVGDGGLAGAPPISLTTGLGASTSVDGRVEIAAVDPTRYVTREQFETMASQTDGAYVRWQLRRRALLRDPSLLAFFDFDAAGQDPSSNVRNLAARPDASRFDGVVRASSIGPGRFASTRAVSFERDHDHVALTINRSLRQVTMAGWYRIDRFDNRFTSLMHSEGTKAGGLHWHLTRTGGGVVLVLVQNRPRDADEWVDVQSPIIREAQIVGRWVHLAATIDADAATARLYMDGVLADESAIEEPIGINLRRIRIGDWDAGSSPQIGVSAGDRARTLHGGVDEFAVFDRVLDDAEIDDLYRSGAPSP